jgi:serine/arginine repetitive matrix protein 2
LQKHGHDRSRELRRDTGSSQGTEDQRWERGRRASNATTTHSAISGGRDSSRESLRQVPPHLASIPSHTHQLPHLLPPSGRQGSTREPWRQGRSPEQSPVISSSLDTSSPVAPLSTTSVVPPSPQTLTAAPAEVEMARKVAMHSAAERAKARRQRDEEEREMERERARKKAGDLEEKMKSEKAQTQEHPAAQVGFC